MIALPWAVVGVSVAGASHAVRGTPCQDAHCHRLPPGGALVVAVADGAGSAERSDEGAWVAVHRAAATLETALAESQGDEGQPVTAAGLSALMADAFRAARRALESLAEEESVPLGSLACTLTCCVAVDDRCVVGQLGDGVAVARGVDGTLFSASRPQRGDYANETCFLTMSDALDLVEFQVFEQPIDALAVTTDGLLRLAVVAPDCTPHAPFFDPLFRFAERVDDAEGARSQLATFLSSERVNARTDDDKTLVLAVRRTLPAAGT